MEQEQNLDKQKSAVKDLLNEGVNRLVSEWKSEKSAIEASSIAGRLNEVFIDAQKSGYGIEIRLYNSVMLGQEIPGMTNETKKYITQDSMCGSIVLDLQTKEEREKMHSRKIDIVLDAFRLHLVSSKTTEGHFWKEQIESIKIK